MRLRTFDGCFMPDELIKRPEIFVKSARAEKPAVMQATCPPLRFIGTQKILD
jgi:hypothetical protein